MIEINNTPKMYMRVDASASIGRGHLSRLMAVAYMLESEFDVIFLIAGSNEIYCKPLVTNWTTYYLAVEDELTNIVSIRDILWVDGYHFDEGWRLKFQPVVNKLVYVSDFPGALKGVDVILNNCPGVTIDQYKECSASSYLLGLDYVLIRPKFLKCAKSEIANPNHHISNGVFVCFGGADPLNVGQQFVQYLMDNDFKGPIYFVTSNENNKVWDSFENVTIMNDLSEEGMIDGIQNSKVTVVSSSVLSYEVIALRKPLYVSYYVDNQENIYSGLLERNVAVGGGKIDNEQSMLNVYKKFEYFYNNSTERQKMIENQENAIDGYSGERIVKEVKKWLR